MSGRGIHRVRSFAVANDMATLRKENDLVFLLPVGIKDSRTFFEAVKSILPLDPPLVGDRSWDALSDSLWGGIDRLDARRIAVVWPGAVEMEQASPDEFKIVESILVDLSNSLASEEHTVGNPKELTVILA